MSRQHISLLGLAIVWGIITASLGCGGDGVHLVDVTGTVRLEGEPLPAAQITFIPTSPGGSAAYGVTDGQGRYRLKFSRDRYGAMPGPNDVVIDLPSRREIIELRMQGEPVPDENVRLPRKYTVPGTLTADVAPRGGTYDFDLESE
jgi:hypothetical protein